MSIALFICNPMDPNEEKYYFPISTEEIFRIYWLPVVEKKGLNWIKCFYVGVELEKKDYDYVLNELEEVRKFNIEKTKDERSKQVVKRIESLQRELKQIYLHCRDDILVYMG